MPPSEFALQTCNDNALIIQDFTTNKQKVLSAISPIQAEGNNDFVEQLLNRLTGLLNIAKQGKNKKQARTSGRRTAILELLSKKAMSRQEILTALEAKGDKRAEQSISNTLSILKKAGRIGLENGIYSSKMT